MGMGSSDISAAADHNIISSSVPAAAAAADEEVAGETPRRQQKLLSHAASASSIQMTQVAQLSQLVQDTDITHCEASTKTNGGDVSWLIRSRCRIGSSNHSSSSSSSCLGSRDNSNSPIRAAGSDDLPTPFSKQPFMRKTASTSIGNSAQLHLQDSAADLCHSPEDHAQLQSSPICRQCPEIHHQQQWLSGTQFVLDIAEDAEQRLLLAQPAAQLQHGQQQQQCYGMTIEQHPNNRSSSLCAAAAAKPSAFDAAPVALDDDAPWYYDRQVVLAVLGYGTVCLLFCALDELVPIYASAPLAQGEAAWLGASLWGTSHAGIASAQFCLMLCGIHCR
jgi:hypothetical protein